MANIPVVVIGAGGFGREVAWLIEEINAHAETFDLLGFLDDAAASTPEGYPILGTTHDWLTRGRKDVLLTCGIGDPLTRRKVTRRFSANGCRFATLIHPTVRLSRFVEIGEGAVICAGNILTTNIRVGAHALINLDCTIGHDAVLGEYSSLMPGVHISGDVLLGAGTYFGTGAAVINSVSVGEWTTVGAGAVVTTDLPERMIAVGVPAKAVKPNPRQPLPDE